MKKQRKKILGILVFAVLLIVVGGVVFMFQSNRAPLSGGKAGNGEVTTYPFGEGMKADKAMKVLVQDAKKTQQIQLYAVNINPKRNYPTDDTLLKKAAVATFDMKGTVSLPSLILKQSSQLWCDLRLLSSARKSKGKRFSLTSKNGDNTRSKSMEIQ